MIKNIADFLEELKKNGIDLINKNRDVEHPGMTGDIFEGLTSEILKKSIFSGFNLKITKGKIRNNNNELSSQIDCMLVTGDGEQVPFTDHYIYHYSQVIAVLEVKKTLNKQQISNSHKNLESIIKVSRGIDYEGEKYMIRLLRTSWELLTNTELPKREEVESLPEHLQIIYHTLLMEAYFPLRIVFGYFGYNSEYSLREGFVKMLEEKISSGNRKGLGVGSLPSLMICKNFSLIKSNGMPFAVPFQKKDFYWPILISTNNSPLLNLLELIWTRLSFKYEISSSIFGDDLEIDSGHRFLDCKFDKDSEGNKGWSYSYFEVNKTDLSRKFPKQKWKPAELNEVEFKLINVLCNVDEIKLNGKFFKNLLEDSDYTKDQLINSLIKKRMIFKKDNTIKLSTRECMAIIKNGKYYAGENFNGLMMKWVHND